MLRIVESRKVPTSELSLLAEQLWPGLGGLDLRVSMGVSEDPNWVPVESHGVALWRGRIGMLLPENRRSAARALTQYAHLRPVRRRIVRRVWAALISSGIGAVWDTVVLEARIGSSAVETQTAVQCLKAHWTTSDYSVAMSIRRTANRKALLQVVDGQGRTAGFAKLGWNAISALGVHTESKALRQLEGGSASFRAPQVMRDGVVNGFPYVLIEPLPDDIRRVGIDSKAPPTNSEFAAISPVVRQAPPTDSSHVKYLKERVAALGDRSQAGGALADLRTLLDEIDSERQTMPIVARWHGDFAFWNLGRTPDGVLWGWDFENSGSDALLGLDILHWHASRVRQRSGAAGLADAAVLQREAEPDLRVCGLDDEQRRVVQRVYVAEVVTRACEMAASDGWGAVWATPDDVVQIARSACR